MNDSERERQRQLARTVRSVQNMQVMLLAGLIGGGLIGILLSAYVVLPMMGVGSGAFVAFFVVIPVCAFLGNRAVLWALSG